MKILRHHFRDMLLQHGDGYFEMSGHIHLRSSHEAYGFIHDGGKALGFTMLPTSDRWEL